MAHVREASSTHSHDTLGGIVESLPITHQIGHDERISFRVRSGSALLAAYHLELEEVLNCMMHLYLSHTTNNFCSQSL